MGVRQVNGLRTFIFKLLEISNLFSFFFDKEKISEFVGFVHNFKLSNFQILSKKINQKWAFWVFPHCHFKVN